MRSLLAPTSAALLAVSGASAATITTEASGDDGFVFGGLNQANLIGQSFVAPADDPSSTQLDTFSFDISTFTRRSSTILRRNAIVPGSLRGFLLQLDADTGRTTLLSVEDPILVATTDLSGQGNSTVLFEDVTFAPRDADGDRIDLIAGNQYVVVAVEQRFVTNQTPSVQLTVGTTDSPGALPDGEAFSLQLTAADIDRLDGTDALTQFGRVRTGGFDFAFSAVLVPEPASLLLASAGGLLLLCRRR